MRKHFLITIDDTVFSYTRDQESITEEEKLDGIYVIRTSVPDTLMDAGTVVGTYKSLARVERDFRSIKSIDLDLRPIFHRTETRVRAHVFICMLAAYLLWHLRKAWAPLTFTDEHRPDRRAGRVNAPVLAGPEAVVVVVREAVARAAHLNFATHREGDEEQGSQ